jgi:hypothetical protein
VAILGESFKVLQKSLFKPLQYHFSGVIEIMQNSLNPPCYQTLPIELWQKIFGLLDITDAITISKASPRTFGALIEYENVIRYRNAINSYKRPDAFSLSIGSLPWLIGKVLLDSSRGFSGFISWIERKYQPVLQSSILNTNKVFEDLSSILALNDSGFLSTSSSLSDWTVNLVDKDLKLCSVSWILLYRASASGYRAIDFHKACDGMGKCVVIVKAENGGVAAAYNEDGFTSHSHSPNTNGFLVSIDKGRAEVHRRNENEIGIVNHSGFGPVFGNYPCDIAISNNCHQNEGSFSNLYTSYGDGANEAKLFGQETFRVCDYEVYKIVVE